MGPRVGLLLATFSFGTICPVAAVAVALILLPWRKKQDQQYLLPFSFRSTLPRLLLTSFCGVALVEALVIVSVNIGGVNGSSSVCLAFQYVISTLDQLSRIIPWQYLIWCTFRDPSLKRSISLLALLVLLFRCGLGAAVIPQNRIGPEASCFPDPKFWEVAVTALSVDFVTGLACAAYAGHRALKPRVKLSSVALFAHHWRQTVVFAFGFSIWSATSMTMAVPRRQNLPYGVRASIPALFLMMFIIAVTVSHEWSTSRKGFGSRSSSTSTTSIEASQPAVEIHEKARVVMLTRSNTAKARLVSIRNPGGQKLDKAEKSTETEIVRDVDRSVPTESRTAVNDQVSSSSDWESGLQAGQTHNPNMVSHLATTRTSYSTTLAVSAMTGVRLRSPQFQREPPESPESFDLKDMPFYSTWALSVLDRPRPVTRSFVDSRPIFPAEVAKQGTVMTPNSFAIELSSPNPLTPKTRVAANHNVAPEDFSQFATQNAPHADHAQSPGVDYTIPIHDQLEGKKKSRHVSVSSVATATTTASTRFTRTVAATEGITIYGSHFPPPPPGVPLPYKAEDMPLFSPTSSTSASTNTNSLNTRSVASIGTEWSQDERIGQKHSSFSSRRSRNASSFASTNLSSPNSPSLSFSSRKNSVRKTPPAALQLPGRTMALPSVYVETADEGVSESPGQAMRALQSRLQRFSRPDSGEQHTRGDLLSLEKELGQQESQWHQLAITLDRHTSTSTIGTMRSQEDNIAPLTPRTKVNGPSSLRLQLGNDEINPSHQPSQTYLGVMGAQQANRRAETSESWRSKESPWSHSPSWSAKSMTSAPPSPPDSVDLERMKTSFGQPPVYPHSSSPPQTDDEDEDDLNDRDYNLKQQGESQFFPSVTIASASVGLLPSPVQSVETPIMQQVEDNRPTLWTNTSQLVSHSINVFSVAASCTQTFETYAKDVVLLEKHHNPRKSSQWGVSVPLPVFTTYANTLWAPPQPREVVQGSQLWSPINTVGSSSVSSHAIPRNVTSSTEQNTDGKPRKSVESISRRRTFRGTRRFTTLPDIVECPIPLSQEDGALGIFQFPDGETSAYPAPPPRTISPARNSDENAPGFLMGMGNERSRMANVYQHGFFKDDSDSNNSENDSMDGDNDNYDGDNFVFFFDRGQEADPGMMSDEEVLDNMVQDMASILQPSPMRFQFSLSDSEDEDDED